MDARTLLAVLSGPIATCTHTNTITRKIYL